MFFFLIVLILASISSSADVTQENSCSKIDLRESQCLPAPKNQTDSDFCFAFAAADVLSFHFCKEVSPLALGVATFKKAPSLENILWPRSGSWPKEAIQVGLESGFCLESEMPSQVFNKHEVVALKREYQMLKNKITEYENKKSCGKSIHQVEYMLPMTELTDIMSYIASQQKTNDFLNLILSSCKNPIRQKVNLRSCRGDGQEKLKFVNDHLAKGPIAVGVKDTDKLMSSNLGSLSNHHAVTVIGRKFENGTCQYLVRDSAKGKYKQGGFLIGSEEAPTDDWVSEAVLVDALSGNQSQCTSVY